MVPRREGPPLAPPPLLPQRRATARQAHALCSVLSPLHTSLCLSCAPCLHYLPPHPPPTHPRTPVKPHPFPRRLPRSGHHLPGGRVAAGRQAPPAVGAAGAAGQCRQGRGGVACGAGQAGERGCAGPWPAVGLRPLEQSKASGVACGPMSMGWLAGEVVARCRGGGLGRNTRRRRPIPAVLQGWKSMRARAAQLGTRVRLAFSRGPGRRRRSGAGSGAGAEGGAAQAGYRPVGGGGGEDAGGDGEEGGMAVPHLPSRLREVLVAGSVESSANLAEGASPPLRRPLLAADGSRGSSPGAT